MGRDLPGRGSCSSLDLPLPSDSISSILEITGIGEDVSISGIAGLEVATVTFPLPLSFMSCAWGQCLMFQCDIPTINATDQYTADGLRAKHPKGQNGQFLDTSSEIHPATHISASCISGASVSISPASCTACRRFANSPSSMIFFSAAASFWAN